MEVTISIDLPSGHAMWKGMNLLSPSTGDHGIEVTFCLFYILKSWGLQNCSCSQNCTSCLYWSLWVDFFLDPSNLVVLLIFFRFMICQCTRYISISSWERMKRNKKKVGECKKIEVKNVASKRTWLIHALPNFFFWGCAD